MSTSERPGVYTSYTVSNSLYSGSRAGTAGIAAACASGGGELAVITAYEDAAVRFGAESVITQLIKTLFSGGVSVVKAFGVSGNEYAAAFEKLASEEDVGIIVTDSREAAVHAQLKSAITGADQRNAHKIGVVESAGSTSAVILAAQALNCERIVMVTPEAVNEDGSAVASGSMAAAVCAAVLSESDPAIPLNGAELKGICGTGRTISDGDIDLLVRGGVTPVECARGTVNVVRAITTRSTTGGATDGTWRELSTVRIIDDVIPTVRDALRSSFMRAKNTEQTRGAIRSRVTIELEKKLSQEIIAGYENIAVKQNAQDPTVCEVSFDFTVVHGINQIRLTAYITV